MNEDSIGSSFTLVEAAVATTAAAAVIAVAMVAAFTAINDVKATVAEIGPSVTSGCLTDGLTGFEAQLGSFTTAGLSLIGVE